MTNRLNSRKTAAISGIVGITVILTGITSLSALHNPGHRSVGDSPIVEHPSYPARLPEARHSLPAEEATAKRRDSLLLAHQENAVPTDLRSEMSLTTRQLMAYHDPETDLAAKQAAQAGIRAMNQSASGQAQIAMLYFSSTDTDLNATIHDLILDADLKDPALIAQLIEYGAHQSDTDSQLRLIDLIADLNSGEHPYTPEIEVFLAEKASHPNDIVRESALAQWAWYVNRHHGIQTVANSYLFNTSPSAREEIYEMISLGAIDDPGEQREIALTLTSLLHAQYLGISTQEAQRLQTLIDSLSFSERQAAL